MSDDHDKSAMASWRIAVTSDNVAPNVSLAARQGNRLFTNTATIDVGSDLQVRVTATDNVGVEQITLAVNGLSVALDGTGTASVPANALCQMTLLATATDAAGNIGRSELLVTVIDPAQPNQPTPGDTTKPPHPNRHAEHALRFWRPASVK